MKITVNQDSCVASGQCVLTAPDVFDQREEDGVVVLIDPGPRADRADDVHLAAGLCPGLAITVEDD